jgi:hypothetical protein
MPLSTHDELLLRDLRLQPLPMLFSYAAVGAAALVGGFLTDGAASRVLCAGGGFLIALGGEKLVTRRIRRAAHALVAERPALGATT